MKTLIKLSTVISLLIAGFVTLSAYLWLGSTLISNVFLIDYTAWQFAQLNILIWIIAGIIRFFKQ